MIKKISFLWLVILLLFCTGCMSKSEKDYSSNITKVSINTYYSKPESLNTDNVTILKGVGKGEYIEIRIKGKIRNFQHLELKWDNKKNKLVEDKVIHKYEDLEDITLIIETYMPEGIPSEKIKWESTSGNEYEYIIAEKNFKNEGESITEFIIK